MTRVPLGPVSHFSLAVSDPVASAAWWTANFDVDEIFSFDDRIGVGNGAILIVLFAGMPDPRVVGHLAFRTASLDSLERARDALRAGGVSLEDPGDEIGPVGPGSPNLGLWFHDADGYRWELFCQLGAID